MWVRRGMAWIVLALCLTVAVSPLSLVTVSAEAARFPCSAGCSSAPASPCDRVEHPAQAPPSPAHRPCSTSTACAGVGGPKEPFRAPRGPDEGRLSGLRRIYRKNLFEHPGRAAVYDAIVSNPGIDLAAISRMVLMNRQTLRYHLDLLESHHTIAVVRERGTARYFENSGRYGTLEQRVFLRLRSPTAGAVIALIGSNPGIAQSEIAARIGCSAPTVRWHMHRLLEDGIVTAQRDGRSTRYHLTSGGSATLHQIAAAPSA